MCFSSSLLVVRLLYFVWFGASSCILPYLILHMKSIGIPLCEAIWMNALFPLLQLLTCPLACSIPKRTSSYKNSTLWSLLFTGISGVLLLMAPTVPRPTKKAITMEFHCGPSMKPAITVDKCDGVCVDTVIPVEGVEAFFTECHVDCPGQKQNSFKNTADLCFADDHSSVCHVVEVNNTLSENFTFNAFLGKVESHVRKCMFQLIGVTWHGKFFQHISCPIILTEANSNCVLKCDLDEKKTDNNRRLSGNKLCMEEDHGLVTFAVWIYFGLRCIFHFCLGISSLLVERSLSFVVKSERRDDFKNFTAWSLLATGLVTPLAGLALEIFASTTGYTILFLSFSGATVLTILLVSSFQLEGTTLPSVRNAIKLLPQLKRDLEICVLLFVVFSLSLSSGFLDTFLFWYLDLYWECPYYVMGLTATFNAIIGLPLLVIKSVPNYVKKVGGGNLLCLCFFLQSIRYFGYSFIPSFWWCFLFELSGAFSFHILWIGLSSYASELLPNESVSAFQSATRILHYCLGRGFGALVGGLIASKFGFSIAFLAFGSVTAFVGALDFIVYHQIVLKGLPKNFNRRKARVKDEEGGLEERNVLTLLKQESSPSSNDENEVSIPLRSLQLTNQTETDLEESSADGESSHL